MNRASDKLRAGFAPSWLPRRERRRINRQIRREIQARPAATAGQIADFAAACQNLIAATDTPWKANDRAWFRQNPKRAHRVRKALPGEFDEGTPAGHVTIAVVQQTTPGARRRGCFHIRADLLPAPDDEAIAHALFQISARCEPMPDSDEAFCVLIERYQGKGD
jgi:hypothetical protein